MKRVYIVEKIEYYKNSVESTFILGVYEYSEDAYNVLRKYYNEWEKAGHTCKDKGNFVQLINETRQAETIIGVLGQEVK